MPFNNNSDQTNENDASIAYDGNDNENRDPIHFYVMNGNSVPNLDDNDSTHATVTAEPIPALENQELQVGDHVYQWRSLCGLPSIFQHHGIIMDIIKDEEGKPARLIIADFSNVETKSKLKNTTNDDNINNTNKSSSTKEQEFVHTIKTTSDDNINNSNKSTSIIKERESVFKVAQPLIESTRIKLGGETKIRTEFLENSALLQQNNGITMCDRTEAKGNDLLSPSTARRSSGLEQEGILRTYTDTDNWHKVHYEASWWKCQVRRSGTATNVKSDPSGLVLARVSFIIQHPDQLPNYHVVHANCECVAFWCKTGRWSTLQASSFLELTAAGQAKSTATLAATAAGATTQVTVPSAGILGWFGATTTQSVSWLSLHPMAIPGLACYAVITVGVPAVMYVTAHKKWKKTSQRLCDAFWESAIENPEVFAECITHWSDRGH